MFNQTLGLVLHYNCATSFKYSSFSFYDCTIFPKSAIWFNFNINMSICINVECTMVTSVLFKSIWNLIQSEFRAFRNLNPSVLFQCSQCFFRVLQPWTSTSHMSCTYEISDVQIHFWFFWKLKKSFDLNFLLLQT